MQPWTLAKETTILDNDDVGRKGWAMNTKRNEMEDETKST